MNYLLFSFFVLILLYIILYFFFKRKILCNKFLSKDFTIVGKGIAIFLVLISHLCEYIHVSYFSTFGAIGVALFLFFSGFGLQKSYKKNGLNNYWKKKIINVYIPYIIIEFICYFTTKTDWTIINIFKSLLLLDHSHPFGWYMQCLFIYYITFYFGSILESKHIIYKYLVLLLVSLFILLYFRIIFKEQILSFILGVFTAEYYEFIKKYIINRYVFILSLFISVFSLLFNHFVLNNNESNLFILFSILKINFSLILLIILMNFLFKYNLILTPFYYFGIISYEFYLIHCFFFLNKVSFINILYFILLSFIFSYIYYRLNNKLIRRIL